MIHLLIQFGANVTLKNSNGDTAAKIGLYTANQTCYQILQESLLLSALPYTHDMLTEMLRINLPYETWVSVLSKESRKKSCDLLREYYVDEMACFVALFEGEDRALQEFREGKMVNFSDAWLRGWTRPMGNRMNRRRLVNYLVHPQTHRYIFRQLMVAFSA